MPVQINEMVIKANIMEQNDAANAGPIATSEKIDKEELIRECMERVLEMLNDRNER